MRTILSLILFMLPFLGFSQGEISVVISLVDSKQKPLNGAEVALVETSSGKKISKKSDAMGKVSFVLNEGIIWKVYVNSFDVEKEVEVPERGRSQKSMLITYNPAHALREQQQSTDRSGIQWEVQNHPETLRPTAGKAVLKIKVVSREARPLSGITVRLVDVKNKTGLEAKTSATGMAIFLVDLGASFDVDVNEALNSSYVDINTKPGLMLTRTIEYVPTLVNESQLGDTLWQKIDKVQPPSSSRAYYEVKVMLADNQPAAHDWIYLVQLKGKLVVKAKTDAEGTARFMLPHGYMYMIHMAYEHNIDVINLKKVNGFVNGGVEVLYRPNPRLKNPEMFLPDLSSLFLLDYQNFRKKNYPAPKPNQNLGIYLNWGNDHHVMGTEAILEIGLHSVGQNIMPGNYAFVLDKSGSMACDDRIELLKESMLKLVDRLQPNDYISILVYDTKMEVLFPHQLLGNNKEALKAAIRLMEPGGGTQMKEALTKAYEFVMSKHSVMRNNRIFVLSDGYDFDESNVLEAIPMPFNDKVVCSTIGVGEDYNYSLLKNVAEKGRGNLLQLRDSNDFRNVFLPRIIAEMQPAMFDVKLEIETPAGIQCDHVFGYTPLSSSNGKHVYRLPNLHNAEHTVILAKFSMAKPGAEMVKSPVIVRIRYKDKPDGAEKVVEQSYALKWKDDQGDLKLVKEEDMQLMYAIAELNRAVKMMATFQSQKEYSKAAVVLKDAIGRVDNLYSGKRIPPELKPFYEEVNHYLEVLDLMAKKK